MYKIEINASTVFDLRQKVTRLYDDMNNDFMGRHGSTAPDVAEIPERAGSAMNPMFKPLALGNNMVAAPPAPSVELTQPVARAAAVGEVKRDCRGVPHDTRIHSAEGSVNKDGSWRNRRGVEKDVIAKIEAELKGAAPAVTPMVLPPAPVPQAPPPNFEMQTPAPAFQAPPPFQAPVQLPAQQVVAPPPAYESPIAAAVPILPTGKPMHSFQSFKNGLPDVLAQFVSEKKIDQAYIDSLVVHFAKTNPQIKTIWGVLGNELQCMELFNVFVQSGFITKVD